MNQPSPVHFLKQTTDAGGCHTEQSRHFTGGFRPILQGLQNTVPVLGVECVHAENTREAGRCWQWK